MNTEKMSRKEKIELIRNIRSGKVNIVAGQIVEGGVVLINSGDEFFLNGTKCDLDELKKYVEAIVILPFNER